MSSAARAGGLLGDRADLKIMLIDDDEGMHTLINRIVLGAGYQFCGAYGGEEGLAKFSEEKPDLLLLDVMMPGMNGFEASKIIKQTFPKLPVIIVTAHLGENVAQRCRECGIDDYIIQPVHTKVLYEQLGKFLD